MNYLCVALLDSFWRQSFAFRQRASEGSSFALSQAEAYKGRMEKYPWYFEALVRPQALHMVLLTFRFRFPQLTP